MAVEGDGRGGLEKLAIECGENSDDVVGAGRGLYDTGAGGPLLACKARVCVSCVVCGLAWLDVLLVDSLHKLPNDERYTLNPLDLLLCPDQLALEAPLLVLDVLFLKVNVPAPVSVSHL